LLYASDEISKGLYSEVLPLGSIIGGMLVCFSGKIGYQRWQVFCAIGLQTACVGAMSTATIDNPVKSIILTVIISICTSVVFLNCFVMIGFGILSQDDIGTAAGLAGTARLLFGGIAIAIFSNVSGGRYRRNLAPYVTQAVAKMNVAPGSMKALIAAAGANTAAAYAKVPGITPQVKAAATLANKEAYMTGAHLAYQVALGFGLLGCCAAFCMQSIDERKYTDRTVALQESDRKMLKETRQAAAGSA
jgi:hypothetical protein